MKLLERFLARCQKEWEVEELERSLHLARMKDFLAKGLSICLGIIVVRYTVTY